MISMFILFFNYCFVFQTKDKVKEGLCYYFYSAGDDMFQVSTLLKHFNAQLSTKSIHSRCLVSIILRFLNKHCHLLLKIILVRNEF